MAITKKIFVDGETVIMAEDLNAWQDELIRLDSVKYEKPAGGIPKTELAEAVQLSLGKADTALQPSDVDDELLNDSENPVQNKVVKAALDGKAPVIYDTASGAVASFPDGADGMPIKSLEVNIEPVQEGSGKPSPENIRPISGWTGCNISHSGEDTSDPTVIPINWQTEAGTVYGGTLDVTTGVLTITHHMMQLPTNMSVLSTGIYYFLGSSSFRKKYGKSNVICNMLKTNPNRINLSVSGSGSTSAIYCRDDSCEDVVSFKSKYSSAMFVYELDTPITYQLTPQEVVATLLGTNNIWADCGPVAVEYPADTKLYIDSKIAAAVAALS